MATLFPLTPEPVKKVPIAEDFQAFWAHYPRKTGKLDAEKAYRNARILATHEDLMAGIDRYIQGKPDYADYCHPGTWLRQGRWLDEYGSEPKKLVNDKTARILDGARDFLKG